MELAQPIVEVTVQMAIRTNETNSNGEALWRFGSFMVTEPTLTKMFEKSNANVQIDHDDGTMWVFCKVHDIRNATDLHERLHSGALASYEIVENGSN